MTIPPARITSDEPAPSKLRVGTVERIALAYERGFKATWPRFPYGCCVESTDILAIALRGVNLGATIAKRVGLYDDNGHQWLEASDGTIIDPTLGQFEGGQPLHIVPPDDPRHTKFKPHHGTSH